MTPLSVAPVFNPVFLAIALATVAGCAVALWWLLRAESRSTLLALLVVTSLSLTLRLVHTYDYPHGLNEDEPKVLYAAGRAVQKGTVLAESNISVPILPHALFQGQLIPLFGPGRWAIRTYNLVGGVLSTPAAFAVARAMGLAVAPSLAVGGFVAVLPWSMFYSRVMTGDELTFQQLLLLAALARLVFQSGGWREGALGSFAMTWLLYGYWCTRAMLGMPAVAALLARGRRRLWCVAILAVALLLYWPYVEANRHSMFINQGVNPSYYAGYGNLVRLGQRLLESLTAFVAPVAEDGWLTVRAAAMHPWPMLALALIGSLSGVRRALFLWAGFLGGLAPAVLAWGPPSTHRMLMAYPFVALAAGCALDLIRLPAVRRATAAVAVAVVGWLSLTLYFSDNFWFTETRWRFDWQRTELVESLPLPPSPPVIMMRQITFFRDPRRLVAPNDQELVVDNWFPDERGAVYAFTSEAVALRPFYEALFGPMRVQPFGWTFKVTLEPRDWSWLTQHGWSYQARCGDLVQRGQVPVLYQVDLTFAGFGCVAPAEHVWQGRWLGRAAKLRLRTTAPAAVTLPTGTLSSLDLGGTHVVDFAVEPGTVVTVRTTSPGFHPWVNATLTEATPIGERVPLWEEVEPVFDPPAATGAAAPAPTG